VRVVKEQQDLLLEGREKIKKSEMKGERSEGGRQSDG